MAADYNFVDDGADDFDIPSRDASEEDVLDYGNKCIDRGLTFLRGQPAYPDISKGRQIVHALETYEEAIPDKLSHVRVPRIKRQIKEIVATLSNLRPTWDYTANDPAKYESQSNVLNKLHRAWYFAEEVDRSIRQALQFAASEGTGYLYMTYEKPRRSRHGRIKLVPLGSTSYIPFQQGMDNKIQNAEVGIVCTEIPVQKARRVYHRRDLRPTNNTATNLVAPNSGIRELISNVFSVYLRASGANRRRNGTGNTPTVNIYHLYIKDDSLNETDSPIHMGDFDEQGRPKNNYSYIVPHMGQPLPTGKKIPSGETNPITLEPVLRDETRPATEADCMLYPNLRLIIMSPDTLIYDGPSMFWHGKIPIVQFRFDDWPWNFLGFSLIRDTWRLEESINSRLRARDDAVNVRLNPPIMYTSRMSEEFQKGFSPRIPGGRIQKPEMVDRPVEPVLDPRFFDVPPNVDAEIAADEQRLDFLMGVSDIDALMKLKQLPQSDSLDKLIGASSAIIVDIARNMESSIRELGDLWKFMAFEFCTTAERFYMLGEDGLTVEDFDFDPGNMIPSHLPEEDPTKESRYSRSERARWYVDSFTFNVVPNSYTQITAITKRMIMLQLWRDKTFPMDYWTFCEQMEIPNAGPPPQGAQNMLDRWKEWIKIYTESMAALQQFQGVDPTGGADAYTNGNSRPGRKPTGQVPPHFSHGGTTIAESQ